MLPEAATTTARLTETQAKFLGAAASLEAAGTAPTIDAMTLSTGSSRAAVAKMRRRLVGLGAWPWPDFPRGRASPNRKAAPKAPKVKAPRPRAPKVKAPRVAAPGGGKFARPKVGRPPGPRLGAKVCGVTIRKAFTVGSLEEYRKAAGHLLHGPGFRP